MFILVKIYCNKGDFMSSIEQFMNLYTLEFNLRNPIKTNPNVQQSTQA